METQITDRYMTRTDYVMASLTGASTPLEFKFAERAALKRLAELDAIVRGISSKWFRSKTDEEMLLQTKAEADGLTLMLADKREILGVI